ncbi:MAG TPA: hypothetical protein VFC99_20400 [Acidimicrobiia bacterium]|nr:hypothetical protein [Acidimicrobiia bacterium]
MGLGEVVMVVLAGILVAAGLCWAVVAIAVRHSDAARRAPRGRRGLT